MALFDAISGPVSMVIDDDLTDKDDDEPVHHDLWHKTWFAACVLDFVDEAALEHLCACNRTFADGARVCHRSRCVALFAPALRPAAGRAAPPRSSCAARRAARAGAFAAERPQTTPSAPERRFAHSCVAHAGGLVVFGGRDEGTYRNDAWRLDCASGAWTKLEPAGDAPAPRRAHSATLVGDAMYVVGGGDAARAFGDVHRLDLKPPQAWTRVAERLAPRSPGGARGELWRAFGHSAARLGTSDVLVLFGGAEDLEQRFRAYNDVQLLERGAEMVPYVLAGAPPPPCYRHSCTPLPGGTSFVVAGGYTFAPSISAEELETGRGISLTYSSSRVHTLDVSEHVLGETHVRWAEIKVGGVEWPPRGGHAAVRLGPDQILLCGGGIQRAWLPQDLGSPHEEDLDDCYVLRKKEDGDVGEDAPTWELAALEHRLPSPRGGHVAALVPLRDARGAWDLGVLVFGGRDFHAESGTHKGRDDGVLFSLLSDDDRRHAPPPSP